MNVFNAIEVYTFKYIAKMINFMLFVLHQNKKERTIVANNKIEDSQNIILNERSQTKEYIKYDSIYIKPYKMKANLYLQKSRSVVA